MHHLLVCDNFVARLLQFGEATDRRSLPTLSGPKFEFTPGETVKVESAGKKKLSVKAKVVSVEEIPEEHELVLVLKVLRAR